METTKLKACHVCIRPLENILFDETKPDPPVPMNDPPSGEHYTCSHTQKPVVRTSCIPRKASAGKQYKEHSDTPHLRKGDQSLSNQMQVVHLKLVYLHKKTDLHIQLGDYHQFPQTGRVMTQVTA